MQYLDTEFATVTLENATFDFISKRGVALVKSFLAANFQRIFVEIKNINEFKEIYSILKDYENVFFVLDTYVEGSFKNLIIKIQESYLPKVKLVPGIFYQVKYSESLILYIKKHKELLDYIIFSVPNDMLTADVVFKNNDFGDKELMFRDFILTVQTIKQHPCNIFLCSGLHCHGKKSTLPRNLCVKPNGDVIMHKLERFVLGNINIDTFEEMLLKYENGPLHKKFIDLNRKMYIRYVLTNLLVTIFPDNCLKRICDEHN